MARVILVEAQPWDVASGAATPLRLAGGGRQGYTHKGQTDWFGGVVSVPRVTASIGHGEKGFTGGAIPQTAAIGFMPSRAGAADAVAARLWIGAPITISSGDDEATPAAFTPMLAGTVAALTNSRGALAFTLSDAAGRLAKPIAPATFAGTGGLEGIIEAKGRVKRRSWGQCWNVEARVLDKAANVFEIGDPAFPLHAIDAVRDRGRAGPLAAIGWQGSAAATLDALKVAVPPNGGAAVAPSIACFKWWTVPAGPLAVDLRGEIGAAYVETAPAIAERVSLALSGPAVNALAAAAAARPDPAGLHVGDSSETGAAALDRLLLLGASMAWAVEPAGGLRLVPLGFDAPVETIVAHEIEREAAFAPVTSFTVGFRKNERTHSDGEISAAILATDVILADGQTLAQLAGQVDAIDDDLAALADDSQLTPPEKITRLIPRAAELEAAWTLLDAQAAAIGAPVAGDRAAAAAARTAWLAYRNALAPPWNDVLATTEVQRATFNAKLGNHAQSLTALADALRLANARAEAGNLIRSPVELAVAELANGAFVETVASPVGGTNRDRRRIKFPNTAGRVYPDRQRIPVRPGEVLFFTFAGAFEANATGLLTTRLGVHNAAGVLLDNVDNAFGISLAPDGTTGWRNAAIGNRTMPPGAAEVRPFVEATGGTVGSGRDAYAADFFFSRQQPGADVTAANIQRVSGDSTLQIAANSLNQTTTELPLSLRYRAMRGSIDESILSTFEVVSKPGGVGLAFDATDRGRLDVTQADGAGEVRFRVIRANGYQSIETLTIVRNQASPAQGGGTTPPGSGGASVTSQEWSNPGGATHVIVAGPLTVKSTGSGTLRFSGSSDFGTSSSVASDCAIKAAYRLAGSGGAYADAHAEVASSAYAIRQLGGPDGESVIESGYVSFAEFTRSGLTSSTDYEVVLYARRANASRSVNFIESNFTVRQ